MARSTPSRASDSPRDAVALLKQDHRTVESFFSDFEDAEPQEQSSIAERVCHLLTVHTQIEEEILYPAAKEALQENEEEAELVSEAEIEHGAAKELISKVEGMTPGDEHFRATVKVLGEYIKHHIREEEGKMFPALRQADVDLKDMGARLADRKFSLMEQMGIKEEEPAQPRRKTAAKTRGPAARGRTQARAGSRRSTSRSSGARHARH